MIKVGENITEIPNLNLEKTKLDITEFIKQKVSEANTDGIVVGLSGGIDSTLSAYLACEALGKDKVFGIIMPSTTTPTDDKLHGIEIAQKLGIDYKEIAIDSILNEYLSMTQLEEDELSIGNLKARIRMSIIYYYANAKNYLVSGTGNKSEILIGYFTKYGDGGVDVLPIPYLLKREVMEACKYYGISDRLAERTPTAGLFEGQTDETEMGVKYDVLDDYLLGKEVDEKSKARIEYLHRISEHKRAPLPCPKEFNRD